MMQQIELDLWSEEDEIATQHLILQADQLLLLRSQKASQEGDITLPPVLLEDARHAGAGSFPVLQDNSMAGSPAVEAASAAHGEAMEICQPAPGLEGNERAEGKRAEASRRQEAVQPWLPDLEDIGKVLDRRRYRPIGMSVTDFTEAEWCQQQFALALTLRLPKVVLLSIEKFDHDQLLF